MPNKPTVSVDVKQGFNLPEPVSRFGMAVFKAVCWSNSSIVQELCESRGGRPGLSVLTSLLVSVDVKLY